MWFFHILMEIWCSLTFYNSNLRQTDQKLSKRFCYSHMLLESADCSSKKLMERKGEGCFFGCYTYTHKTERDIIMGVFYIFQNEISPKCAEVVFEKKKKVSLSIAWMAQLLLFPLVYVKWIEALCYLKEKAMIGLCSGYNLIIWPE